MFVLLYDTKKVFNLLGTLEQTINIYDDPTDINRIGRKKIDNLH